MDTALMHLDYSSEVIKNQIDWFRQGHSNKFKCVVLTDECN